MLNFKLGLLIALICVYCASAFGFGRRSGVSSVDAGMPDGQLMSNTKDYPDLWFDNFVDHFDMDSLETYKQRYFVNDAFFNHTNPNSPVFIYIGAEGKLGSRFMDVGLMAEYAKKFGALIYAVEHRYYGRSQPRPDWSNDNLKFLTTEQALADAAHFIKTMSTTNKYKLNTRPWVTFGGSYGGSLSAFMRLKYPHLVHASIASSSVLEPKIDFDEYLVVAVEALRYFGGEQCVNNYRESTKQLSQVLKSPNGFTKVTKDFKLCSPLTSHAYDDPLLRMGFWMTLTDTTMNVVQYNKPNDPTGLRVVDLCNTLAENSSSLYDGLVAIREKVAVSVNEKCMDWDFDNLISALKKREINENVNLVQWYYQTCREYGFYQTSSKTDVFSDLYDITLFDAMCRYGYGPEYTIDSLEKRVLKTNTTFGSYDYRQSNTIFVNNHLDPWSAISINRPQAYVPHAHLITATSHCAILYPESPYDLAYLIQARKTVFEQLANLLYAFVRPRE